MIASLSAIQAQYTTYVNDVSSFDLAISNQAPEYELGFEDAATRATAPVSAQVITYNSIVGNGSTIINGTSIGNTDAPEGEWWATAFVGFGGAGQYDHEFSLDLAVPTTYFAIDLVDMFDADFSMTLNSDFKIYIGDSTTGTLVFDMNGLNVADSNGSGVMDELISGTLNVPVGDNLDVQVGVTGPAFNKITVVLDSETDDNFGFDKIRVNAPEPSARPSNTFATPPPELNYEKPLQF